jgi:hypothetical protein
MTSGLSLSRVLWQQITRDYEEQPDLRLTPQEAQRRWGLDGPTCGAALTLVDAGVLQRSPDGRLMRRRSGPGWSRGPQLVRRTATNAS